MTDEQVAAPTRRRMTDEERQRRAADKAARSAVWQARREAAAERRQAKKDLQRRQAEASSSATGWDTRAEPATKAKPLNRRQRKRARASKADRRLSPAEAFLAQQVTPEARAQGEYVPVILPGPTITKGDREEVTTIQVARNRGGTAIERWFSRGDVDVRKAEAISLYARAWRLWIGEQRVTANWSLVASFRGGAMMFDSFADTKIKAKRLLDLLDNEVFFRLELADFNVWQNVVIFDEPAGVAGGRLGYSNKQAEAAAKLTVLRVAHMIADVMRLGRQPMTEEWVPDPRRGFDGFRP